MRPPLEYGDNFPVVPPSGSWNPAVPWRFPQHEKAFGKRPSMMGLVFPWITLGLGISLGILWMSWWLDLPLMKAGDQSRETSESAVGIRVVVPEPAPVKQPGPPAPRQRPAQSARHRVA